MVLAEALGLIGNLRVERVSLSTNHSVQLLLSRRVVVDASVCSHVSLNLAIPCALRHARYLLTLHAASEVICWPTRLLIITHLYIDLLATDNLMLYRVQWRRSDAT